MVERVGGRLYPAVTMPRRPNLLFMFTDQQRSDTLGCYGNRVIQTPNLDALAEQSFVFENAYVSQPVCTPSRATIMTGLYPHTHGAVENNVPLDSNVKTIAEMVSSRYVRAYHGKWHLGDEIVPRHGFTQRVSMEDTYRPHYRNRDYLAHFSDYHHYLVEQGYEPEHESEGARVFGRATTTGLPEEHTKASFLGREAARFIRNSSGQPFMLYVNFLEPHNPYDGPLNDMYDRGDLETGPAFVQKPPANASVLHRATADYYSRTVKEGHDLSDEASWREIKARYWGNVTLVDRAVGTILEALDSGRQADNTIVVFTSEHGDMMGDHAILEKTVMYEEAMKVPLLVRVPWLAGGRRIPGRVGLVDLVPTLLELMGEPVPEVVQGESRVDVLQGEASLGDNDVFVEWNGNDHIAQPPFETDIPTEEVERAIGAPRRTVISGEGWKLNLSPQDRSELYDLTSDPFEQVNLYDDSGQRSRVRDLAGRIAEWQRRTGDDLVLPEVR